MINLIIIRSDVTRHNVLYIQVLMVIGPDHRVERLLLIHLQIVVIFGHKLQTKVGGD